jgi:hypothetical protein
LHIDRAAVAHPQTAQPRTGAAQTMTAEDVRVRIRKTIPATKDQMAQHLFDYITELKALGLSSTVPSQRDLIPVLAANMAGPGGDAVAKMSAAEQQIIGNNTTALTLSDDRYVGLEKGSAFDELHELIHICSAKGGESPLHNWKLQMNEGAINIFALLTAPKAGVSIDERYTDETRIARKLVKLAVDNGDESAVYQALYGMTFVEALADHHRTTFFGLVGSAYNKIPRTDFTGKDNKVLKNQQTRPNGVSLKPATERAWTDEEAGTEFAGKVKNWSVKWLEERLPNLA